LLSEAGVSGSTGAPRLTGKPSVVPEIQRSAPPSPVRSSNVSPFAADSARKSGSKPELSTASSPTSGSPAIAGGTASVVMGSAAPATIAEMVPKISAPLIPPPQMPAPEAVISPISAPETSQEPEQTPAASLADVRGPVLTALGDAGQRMLSAMLETGEWQTAGNELIIKVASSSTVIEMSLGADAKRLIVATASGVLGRPVRLKVVSGGVVQAVLRNNGSSNGGGRGRAEQDPVVSRMKEKFGAEIRTIIDYKEKR
jgi:hypothetical protein